MIEQVLIRIYYMYYTTYLFKADNGIKRCTKLMLLSHNSGHFQLTVQTVLKLQIIYLLRIYT